MEERIFNFSETLMGKKREDMYIVMAMFSVLFLIYSYIVSTKNGTTNIIEMVIVDLVLIPLILIPSLVLAVKNINRQKEGAGVALGADRVECRSWGFKTAMNYRDIKAISVKRRRGEILSIVLESERKKINIWGFDDMEGIFSSIKERAADNVVISERVCRVTKHDRWILIASGVGTGLVMAYILTLLP